MEAAVDSFYGIIFGIKQMTNNSNYERPYLNQVQVLYFGLIDTILAPA